MKSLLIQTRLDLLKTYMNEQGIDIALITSPINIYYLTGFFSNPHERFMALLVDGRTGMVSLFVPALDLELATEKSTVTDLIPVTDTDNPYEMLKDSIGTKIESAGIEKKAVSFYQIEQLVTCFPQVNFKDLEGFLGTLRLKKSSEDIQIVRRAVEVIEKVLQYGVDKFKVGMTELELTAELEYQMKVLGAERPAFSTIVLSGANSSLPHGTPGQKKIEHGGFLLFDMGVFVDGYCSDITRTFIVGEETEQQKQIYNTVLEANLRAIEAAKIGEPIGVVDRAARDYIESQGYGQYFVHRTGHGLGLEVHESPSIHSQNEMVMEPGLLFTIEPGIYLPGVGGVRIEDDVYLNEEGKLEVLTSYPKHLIRLS